MQLEKSVIEPTQQIVFLGFLLCSVTMQLDYHLNDVKPLLTNVKKFSMKNGSSSGNLQN